MPLYNKARELARSGKKPIEHARDMGIRILYAPFKRIKGLALSLGTNKFIIIDDGLSEAEQQFVCGHELGHFLLHPSTNFLFILQNTFYYSKQEYQANYFSFALMLGEKAEAYKTTISEAVARGRLDELVRIVGELVGMGDDVL